MQFGVNGLVLAALALAALWTRGELRNWTQHAPSSGLVAAVESDLYDGPVQEPSGSKSRTQYVQEPQGRTSFRPDFSSSRRANQRGNYAMLRAFNEAVVDARRSTVLLLDSGGDQIALGAIVDAEGWIATKASQLPSSGTILVRLHDESQVVAEVVQRVSDVDIALLRINRQGLTPVSWSSGGVPARGSWLATTDVDKMPSAVGVVSAGIQSVQATKPILGVELVDSSQGAAVMRVLEGTGADLAGLQQGDNILAVNNIKVHSHNSFQSAIQLARGGELIQLTVNRGERTFETEARLMDLSDELLDDTEMEVNGRISARATGFSRVFLHDTVLEPNQCGGPLCNLDGQVVGLNIARAGRVSSYALPADVIRPVIEGLIAQATLVSRPSKVVEATAVR